MNHRVTAPALVILLGVFCGCGSDSNVVVVDVANLPPRATKLTVNATLSGKPAQNAMDITSPLDGFVVRLPSDASGQLTLDIEAIDSDGCSQGQAAPEYGLPSSVIHDTVNLTAQSPRRCGALPPCPTDEFCSITKPTNNSIKRIYATAPDDVWAVGVSATILHYDGKAWSQSSVPAGVTQHLYGVWASGAHDVWAVGQSGVILHYDGSKWATVPSPVSETLNSITGLGPTEIWAVGMTPGDGMPGRVLHYSGDGWTSIMTAGTVNFNDVWAGDVDFVHLCGDNGAHVRFYLGAWGQTTQAATSANLMGIWGTANRTLYAVGVGGAIIRVRYLPTAGSWTSIPSSTVTNLFSIRGDGQSVYAVGDNGIVLRAADANGNSFVPLSSSATTQLNTLSLSSSLVWVGGSSGFLGFVDRNP